MQTLPYCVVANPHFNDVYELYYDAFDKFRRVPEIRSLEENDSFCRAISTTLKAHLSVIPKLAMGILEVSADDLLPAEELGEVARDLFGDHRVRVVRRLDDALELAVTLAETGGALGESIGSGGVLVTGSVVTVGEARALLKGRD